MKKMKLLLHCALAYLQGLDWSYDPKWWWGYICSQAWGPLQEGSLKPSLTIALYFKIVVSRFLRMALAIALAVSNNSMGVTTQLTRPHFSAVCASTGSAVNDTWLALRGPITQGSFCDNPHDGNIPNLHQWQCMDIPKIARNINYCGLDWKHT